MLSGIESRSKRSKIKIKDLYEVNNLKTYFSFLKLYILSHLIFLHFTFMTQFLHLKILLTPSGCKDIGKDLIPLFSFSSIPRNKCIQLEFQLP